MASNRDTFTTEIYVNSEQAQDAFSELNKTLAKLENQYKNLNKNAKNYEIRERELSDQIKATKESIDTAQKGTEAYGRAMQNLNGRSLNNLIKLQRQLNSEIKKLDPNTAEFKELSENYRKVTDRIHDLERAQKGILQSKGLLQGLNGISGALIVMKGAFNTVTSAARSFANTYKTISNFEQANANLSTILGVTRDQMKDLEDAALKLGSTTRYTASEVTNLQTELAKLGFTQKEILDMEPSVLNFATSVGTDLASAASMAGVALRSFGLTSEETEDALGTMAAACNKSALSFAYLQNAFSTIAPVAKTYGLSLKDTIALLGTLANAGFDASSAATATRNILLNLADTNGKLAQALGGTVNSFDDIMDAMIILRSQGVDLNQTLELTDKRSVSAFNTFLDGAESAKELRGALEDVNGELQRTADVRADTVEGAVAGLQSAWEGFILSFRNSSGTVKEMLKTVTDIVRKLPQYSDGIAKVTKSVLAVVLAVKAWTLAEKAKNAVVATGNKLSAAVSVVTNAVRLAYFRVTGQTIKAAAAQTALNAAMAANPFGAVIAVIGALTAAIGLLVGRQRDAAETTDYLAEAEKNANEEYGEQAGRIKALTSIIENNNISLAERKKALDELKKIVPGYHGDLTEEGRLINSNKEAIDEYCKSLREKIRLEARKDQLAEIEKQIAALEDQKADAQERQHQALVESGGDTKEKGWGKRSWFTGKLEFTPYGQAVQDAKDLQDQIDILEKQAEKISDRIGKVFTDPIEKIKAEYEAMFDQIRKESVDAPNEGEIEIKRLKEERDLKIEEIRKTYAVKNTVEQSLQTEANTILTQTQYNYLQERQDKLTKKEREMVVKGYASLSEEESKSLKARYDKLMKADQKLGNQRYQQEVKSIEMQQREELNTLNRQLFDREITSDQHEERLVEIKVKYLEEKKTLAEKYGQDTSTIEQQLLTAEVERYKFYYNQELKLSEKRRMEEEISLREQLSAQAITQEEFDRRMLESREKYLKEQQELALGYNQDGSGIQLKDIQTRQKEEESALKQHLINQKITQEEYDRRMIDTRVKYIQQRLHLAQQSGQDETSILQEYLDAQLEADELAEKQMAKLKEDAKKVISGLNPSDARKTELEEQLKQLDVLHNAKLLSEEQFREAVRKANKQFDDEELQARLSNVQKYTEQVNSIMQEASNFVNALKEAESAQLEAQYQADLTAAGDNAEKREQIEADYEQKKLDLQKKYADVDMAINIAKTVANGAAAVVKALADPGGVAGTILAVTIGATTAAEVATIIAQRNAIKNTSVNSSGTGGSSSANTGTRTVTGYSEGGNTRRAASDATVVGVVHANEWVAPAWMVRKNPTVFADLEHYRRTLGSDRKKLAMTGFDEGGYTGNAVGVSNIQAAVDNAAIEEAVRKGIRAALEGEWVRAYIVRRDLTEMDAQDARFKSQTSRS